MKSNHTFLLVPLVLIFMVSSFQVNARTVDKKKSVGNNGEKQRAFQEAVTALNNQVFLISLYSFIDKTGNVVGIEPEGNFINVNKDKFMMHKSVSLILSTFAGSDIIKGELSDFRCKENAKGSVVFSFVISEGEKVLTFKGKMNKGDNIIEGSIKGRKEEREISLNGNVQPLKAHFSY